MCKVKNNMSPTYISTLFEKPAVKYKLRNHDPDLTQSPFLEGTRSSMSARRYGALFLVM